MFSVGIRAIVRREVRHHCATNPELKSIRRNLILRIIYYFFRDRGILWFSFIYIATSSALLAASIPLSEYFTIFSGLNDGFVSGFLFSFNASVVLQAVDASISFNKVLLTVQATLLAVVLPVAIALVSLAQSQEDQVYSKVMVRSYFLESGAYELGRSSIVLVLGLMVIVLLPFESSAYESEIYSCKNCLGGVLITIFNSIWLSINVILLWHFLRTSLDFARPEIRTEFVQRFQANFSMPIWLENELTRLCFQFPVQCGLINEKYVGQAEGSPVSIYFSSSMFADVSDYYVESEASGILYDVWFSVLRWVIRRWFTRTLKMFDRESDSRFQGHAVMEFPISMGEKVSGKKVLCRIGRGAPLHPIEAKIIRLCFRFRRLGR